MRDLLLVLVISATCFLLWLLMRIAWRRRKQPEAAPATAQPKTFEALTTLSPAWHNEQGWPAHMIEMFPPLGPGAFNPDCIELVEQQVTATYIGNDSAPIDKTEILPGAPDVKLESAVDEISEHYPAPRCKAVFCIHKTILERARQNLPAGYDPVPTQITIKIKMALRNPK